MAPIKFEEQLKEKLEERQLKPSEDSWDKLNSQLDAKDNKNQGFWWLGIAASTIIVLVVIATVFIEKTENVETISVDIEKPSNIELNKDINVVDVVSEEKTEASKEDEQVEVKNRNNQKKIIDAIPVNNNLKKEQQKLVTQKTKAVIADNSPRETILKDVDLNFEDQKAKEIVAQIQSLQQLEEVSEAEIDALLRAAQKEITLKKLYNESLEKIDANALLLSVEDELEEQSFRTRVFEMLKSGYREVKTAVVERNN